MGKQRTEEQISRLKFRYDLWALKRRYKRLYSWLLTGPLNRVFACPTYFLRKSSFFRLFEQLGKLAVLGAAISYLYPGCEQRQKAADDAKKALVEAQRTRDYVAWQLLDIAEGKSGDGGRTLALHDLIADKAQLQGVSLAGLIVMQNSNSEPFQLTNVDFANGDFSSVQFQHVDLTDSIFGHGKWDFCNCAKCDFRGCDFWEATFTNIEFSFCNFGKMGDQATTFQGAKFKLVHTSKHPAVKFTNCNFAEANFVFANFFLPIAKTPNSVERGFDVEECNFAFADFGLAIFWGSMPNFRLCNLYGTEGLPPNFVSFVLNNPKEFVFTNIVDYSEWIQWADRRDVEDLGTAKHDNSEEYKAERLEWARSQWERFLKPEKMSSFEEWLANNVK